MEAAYKPLHLYTVQHFEHHTECYE